MRSFKRNGALSGERDQRRAGQGKAVRRVLIGLTLGAMVTGGTVLATSSAQAATTGPIHGIGSGRCIDVPGGGAEGVQLEIWDCNGGANQSVTQNSNGSLEINGQCLDAENKGTADGTRVLWWACNGQNNQSWTWNGSEIRNSLSGKCLDVTGAATVNGTLLEIWTCSGNSNQTWANGSATGTGGGSTPPPTTPPSTGGGSGPTKNLTVPGNLGVHDPSRIVNDGGSYYFYGTGAGGWYTTDGKNWKSLKTFLPNGLPSEVKAAVPTGGGQVWAPDIIWNPNTKLFGVYYAVPNGDTTKSATALVTSPTLNPNASNYKWTDRGIVIAQTSGSDGYSAIDPAPFFDASGNMWMSFGSGYTTANRVRTINIISLDKNTGLRSSNKTIYNQINCSCEASYVQYHSGYYYLFWNTGGCCSGASSTYTIHVARATSPQGPYTGTRTFFASTGSIHGPGQIGVLSQNGQDYFSYHYYPNSGGSVLGYDTLNWSGGWPVRG